MAATTIEAGMGWRSLDHGIDGGFQTPPKHIKYFPNTTQLHCVAWCIRISNVSQIQLKQSARWCIFNLFFLVFWTHMTNKGCSEGQIV